MIAASLCGAPNAAAVPLRDDVRAVDVAPSGGDVLVARVGRGGRVAVDAVQDSLDIGDAELLLERPIDLAQDGRLVAAVNGTLLATPQHAISTKPFRTSPRFTGAGLIAALEGERFGSRPVLVDPATGDSQPVGERSGLLERIAADERGVAWLANGCVHYGAVDGTAVTGPARNPCPTAEVALTEAESVLRGRTVRVNVICVAAPARGCAGTALVGDEDAILGRGRFRIPAGAQRRVDVRLTRRGVRFVRRQLRRFGSAQMDIDARARDGRVLAGDGASALSITGARPAGPRSRS